MRLAELDILLHEVERLRGMAEMTYTVPRTELRDALASLGAKIIELINSELVAMTEKEN